MQTLRTLMTVMSALLLTIPPTADAAARIRKGGVVANPDGGYSGGRVAAAHGLNGGSYARGRAFQTDDSGNRKVTSAGAFHRPNGSEGARAGTTSRSADGTVSHQSAMAINGEKGSVESNGGFIKTDDGVTQSRTTTATGTGGTSYVGNTSYDKNTGLTHSGTCTNASGQSVSCR